VPSSVDRRPSKRLNRGRLVLARKPFPWRSKTPGRSEIADHQPFAPRSVDELDRHFDRLSMVARERYGQPATLMLASNSWVLELCCGLEAPAQRGIEHMTARGSRHRRPYLVVGYEPREVPKRPRGRRAAGRRLPKWGANSGCECLTINLCGRAWASRCLAIRRCASKFA
jgi:hypothetical protein